MGFKLSESTTADEMHVPLAPVSIKAGNRCTLTCLSLGRGRASEPEEQAPICTITPNVGLNFPLMLGIREIAQIYRRIDNLLNRKFTVLEQMSTSFSGIINRIKEFDNMPPLSKANCPACSFTMRGNNSRKAS
jgi:hypothetical protein